jgi:hypothetical protein
MRLIAGRLRSCRHPSRRLAGGRSVMAFFGSISRACRADPGEAQSGIALPTHLAAIELKNEFRRELASLSSQFLPSSLFRRVFTVCDFELHSFRANRAEMLCAGRI